MDNYQLESDNVSLALTRPLTQFGVPLLAFYSNGVACFLAWTLFQAVFQQAFWLTLFFILFFIINHLTMMWITLHDSFGLNIFWMNATRFTKHANSSLWNNTDSFAP